MFKTDSVLFLALFVLIALGLLVLWSISFQDNSPFLSVKKQMIFLGISICFFILFSFLDWRIFNNSSLIIFFYLLSVALLILVLFFGDKSSGSAGWFNFGAFSFQPVEVAKISLILVLAKYLSSRHLEIWQFRHLVVSGIFAFIPFSLVAIQPDLGGAMIFGVIWLGLVAISGIRIRQVVLLLILFLIIAGLAWSFLLQPYQQSRILSFFNPEVDLLGAGYNREQALIAIGSGRLFGKGLGWGSQTHLRFLPLSKTDFIFASLAESLGLVGVSILLICFLVIIQRLVMWANIFSYNFCKLFTIGFAIKLLVEAFINIGMNLGLLPIIGIALPFVSMGGSHLLAEFIGLGMINSMILRRA
ncbi:MAG: FtsW/RodA/SpoVE family cell cycle protein [Candidatus Pacebacteria bacterium]|jgi:rod shape determining protein RodA|nr:FtsW/RodA/SpoVE family cell cycle protein [Candidatus Paceibacterota bacterium]MDD4994820.1 FtsW/RodA/SpoVE family cell cycle protein [Candidatus Paceibacterota bacterium]MDD5535504.1 FtsW/RodA/SpoVE family cell cycle protein [Candidatus Paceibacterota bacterium]